MFDFSSDFANSFEALVNKIADGGYAFERASGIVQAKPCADKKELAAWFRAFARSCKTVETNPKGGDK